MTWAIPDTDNPWTKAWAGLPFDADQDVIVPGALVPVTCGATHDYAIYVEPDVWVRHDLR